VVSTGERFCKIFFKKSSARFTNYQSGSHMQMQQVVTCMVPTVHCAHSDSSRDPKPHGSSCSHTLQMGTNLPFVAFGVSAVLFRILPTQGLIDAKHISVPGLTCTLGKLVRFQKFSKKTWDTGQVVVETREVV
jgi:hypothetical protein